MDKFKQLILWHLAAVFVALFTLDGIVFGTAALSMPTVALVAFAAALFLALAARPAAAGACMSVAVGLVAAQLMLVGLASAAVPSATVTFALAALAAVVIVSVPALFLVSLVYRAVAIVGATSGAPADVGVKFRWVLVTSWLAMVALVTGAALNWMFSPLVFLVLFVIYLRLFALAHRHPAWFQPSA